MMKKFTAVLLSLVMILSTVVLPIMADDGNTGPELVYTVDFRGNDGKFTPAAIGNAAANYDYTPSADGTSLTIKGKSGGANKTQNYWGGTIQGLTADATTVYTMIYQAKNNNGAKDSSISVGGWIKDGNLTIDSAAGKTISFYSNYSNHNATDTPRSAAHDGYTKMGDYVSLSGYEEDGDGFVTVKIIFNGGTKKFTTYILKDGKTGEADVDWMQLSTQNMSLDETPDAFGFMIYGYYNAIDTTVKNVQIYKETYVPEAIVPTGPVATKVVGKTITVDGLMDVAEGWSVEPTYKLALDVKDPTTKAESADNTVDTDPATARFSYDGEYIYIYYETANPDLLAPSIATSPDQSFYMMLRGAEQGMAKDANQADGTAVLLKIELGGANLAALSTSQEAVKPSESYVWKGSDPTTNAAIVKQFRYTKDGSNNFSTTGTIYQNTEVAVFVTRDAQGADIKRAIEIKFPLADAYKTALATEAGADLCVSLWEKTNDHNGTAVANAGYIVDYETYDWNGKAGVGVSLNLPNLDSVVAPAATGNFTIENVDGKTVTVDGTMDATEGWNAFPYVGLDSMRVNPTKVDTETSRLTENYSTVRLSYDSDYLYLFYETYQTQKDSVYFLVGYEDAKRDGSIAKDNYLDIRINTTESAVRGVSTTDPVIRMLHTGVESNTTSNPPKFYVAGDAFYDLTKVAVVVSETKTTIEMAIPIPDVAKIARMSGDYDKITFGAWERIGAANDTGLVSSEKSYVWNVGTMKLTMSKNESGIYNEFVEWLEGTKTTANHDSLKNLTVNILGDEFLLNGTLESYYTWKGMLKSKYEWEIIDYTEKGLLVSTHDKNQLLPLVKKYRTMTNNNPDLVIISGGLNDYIKGAPIGTIDDTTDSTYMGALNVLIKGLRQKYPDACIVFTTGWNATNATTENTATYQAYADAMVQVCEARQVYCFKAYDTTVSGVDMSSEEFRTANCQAADDTLNLNLEGMKLLMPKIEAFLAESVAHWAENKETIMESQKDFIGGGSSNNGGSTNNGGSSNKGDETTAPETSAPTTTTEKKKGCGGMIGVGSAFAVVAIVSLAGVACFKKNDEE